MKNRIPISPLPDELHSFLQEKGLTHPTNSFHNCFLAVMKTLRNRNFKLNYCVAWMRHPEHGVRTQCALLRSGSHFHDPTFQSQNSHWVCTYELEKEFSLEELIHLIGQRFELRHLEKMITGEAPWWLLVKTEDGFDFIDAPEL